MIRETASFVTNDSDCAILGDHAEPCCVSVALIVMSFLACLPNSISIVLWSHSAVKGISSIFFRAMSAFQLLLLATVGGSYCLPVGETKVRVHTILHSIGMGALHGFSLSVAVLVFFKYVEVFHPPHFSSLVSAKLCLCVCVALLMSGVAASGVIYTTFVYSVPPIWAMDISAHAVFYAVPWLITLVFNGLLARALFTQFHGMAFNLNEEGGSPKRSIFFCVVVTSFVSFLVYPFIVIQLVSSKKCVSDLQVYAHILISWINFGLYICFVEQFQKAICYKSAPCCSS